MIVLYFFAEKSYEKLQLLTLILLSLFISNAYGSQIIEDNDGGYVSEQLIVFPRGGADEAKIKSLFKSEGAEEVEKIKEINMRVIKVPPGREKELLEKFKRNKHFQFVELNRIIDLNYIPNDPIFNGTLFTSDTVELFYPYPGWHYKQIRAYDTWNMIRGSSNVVVAVIDSGVESTHPDLQGVLVPGWNVVTNTADTSDQFGHGTLVAGTIASTGDNSLGVAGVAYGAKIMPIRVTEGTVGYSTVALITNAIIWAANNGANLANASFAKLHQSDSINVAAGYLRLKGGLLFAGAGNTSSYDGSADSFNIITVGATGDIYAGTEDFKASFSTYGPYVDLSAPGREIASTKINGTYDVVIGTSFSSPIAAAVGALVKSANPLLKPYDIEKILKMSSKDLGAAGRDDYFGEGRVDAFEAVNLAKFYVLETDTVPPVVRITSPNTNYQITKSNLPITIQADATDDRGIVKLELYANGVLKGETSLKPYGIVWYPPPGVDTDVTLTMKAYDEAGNFSSDSILVLVRNYVDYTAPTVTFTSPSGGATISSRTDVVKISVNAVDNIQVAQMELYIDGILILTSTSSTINYNWSTKGIVSGSHSLKVLAKDTSGNVGVSSITVYKQASKSNGR